jgi:hypothetical protein
MHGGMNADGSMDERRYEAHECVARPSSLQSLKDSAAGWILLALPYFPFPHTLKARFTSGYNVRGIINYLIRN